MGFKKNRNVETVEESGTTKETQITEVKEETKTVEEVKPIEEIKEPEKPVITEEKELTDRKLNCGITGDTLEVKEFRAIVKKQGKQINVVITDILSKWNQENYNL